MSEQQIKKVCVIGSGTMGSGIAAHLANLGFNVTLLSISTPIATAGLDKAKQARPPHFLTPEKANNIRVGSTSENIDWAAESDWVCEAIVENLDEKRALFAILDNVLPAKTWLTTNTSGLEISLLSQDLSAERQSRFMGTHFFNPPRYLKLLELIPTDQTDPANVRFMAEFFENQVARRTVVAKDTPGFIANRYGMWSMLKATEVAEKLRLSIENVDAITGPFLGRPRSGSFRLNDLVGLDIMRDIANNLTERCTHDPRIATFTIPDSMMNLLARGYIGEKSGQGYYRKEGKELLAWDLTTHAYRQRLDTDLESLKTLGRLPLGQRIREALTLRDEVGEFLRAYLIPTLQYANEIKEEIAHTILDIDRVMMWGFGWEMGPFAMIDAIGAENIGIKADSFYSYGTMLSYDQKYMALPNEPQYAKITDFKEIERGDTYCIRDLGDDVCALSLTTKMGVISPKVVSELTKLLKTKNLGKFVFTSEAKSFSAGFDLNFFLTAINTGNLDDINQKLLELQQLSALFEAQSCVAAVYGHCLGAGLELALGCSKIVANVETNIGMPEVKVGLIPGGRGTTLMRLNNQFSAKRLSEIATTLTLGTVAANTEEAHSLGYLRNLDVTVFHPDRLLYEAKQLALEATPTQRPVWVNPEGPLTGMIDRSQETLRQQGLISEHDVLIGNKIKMIVSKSISYDQALERERSEFVELCGKALSHARIKHMLDTNKPLRN